MGLLEDKVVVVTGAGRGIGRGEAVECARQGAAVVVAEFDADAGDEVAAEITAAGGRAVAVPGDVSDADVADRLVKTAVETWGALDAVVNNAGILRDRTLVKMSDAEWDDVIRVHLRGHFAPTRAACQYWRENQRPGHLVHTASTSGILGNFGQSNYGAAKAGIAAMTVIASLELGRLGVRANCIGPGGFTRMVGVAMKVELKNPEDYTEFDAMNPGNSAAGVAYLASDLSLHVTGQVLRVVGNNLCVYKPWEMGEQFLATDREGNPKQWDPVDISRILNRYHFHSENPGIDAQRRG
jgi:NAD(P)-dependent dehydrogenase (short-subunit alcohol dehydrogenase family)